MREEDLYKPFVYTVRRERARVKLSVRNGIIRIISNALSDYVWVPFFAFLILGLFAVPAAYGKLVLHVLMFMLVYEAGYIISDVVGPRIERKKTSKNIFRKQPSARAVTFAVAGRAAVAVLAFVILPDIFAWDIIVLYAVTLILFLTHSVFKEQYRLPTFLGLRILKGLVPYLFLISVLPLGDRVLVLSGIVAISMYYGIEYGTRKLGHSLKTNLYSNKNSFLRFLIVALFGCLLTIVIHISVQDLFFYLGILALHHILFLFVRDVKKRIL